MILAGVLLIALLNPAKNTEIDRQNAGGFCGTQDMYYTQGISRDVYEKGKKLFKENCATCHAKNMVSDATGPALSGSFKRMENDSVMYLKFLQGNQNLEDQNSAPNYNHPFQSFKENDIHALLAYIEAIDSK